MTQKPLAEILTYLPLSSMEPKERAMWMLLLPHMDDASKDALKTALQTEIHATTNLYLNAQKKKKCSIIFFPPTPSLYPTPSGRRMQPG